MAKDNPEIDAGQDPSPEAFRAMHPDDRFTGSSGMLFEQAMAQTRMAVCLSDPRQPDMPIVFANRAFRQLTGYEDDEILGRNCRFLQGARTDPAAVSRIRDAIEQEDVIVVELVNYRKNGELFWNALHLGPIYNDAGELLYFFGSQWDVTDIHAVRAEERHARKTARELSHRMKNMFAVISGVVNVTGRRHGAANAASDINERIYALGRAYETTLDAGSSDMEEALGAILQPFRGDQLELSGPPLKVAFPAVSSLSILLIDLVASARERGTLASDGSGGSVHLGWAAKDGVPDLVQLMWAETPPDGADMSLPEIDPMLHRMLEHVDGSLTKDCEEDTIRVTITLPTGV